MTKTSVNKIEKEFLKDAINNISNWADDKYVGGGVEIDKDCAKVAEDFKHLNDINAATKMIPKAKLNRVQKGLAFSSTFGFHNAATSTLQDVIKKLKAFAK